MSGAEEMPLNAEFGPEFAEEALPSGSKGGLATRRRQALGFVAVATAAALCVVFGGGLLGRQKRVSPIGHLDSMEDGLLKAWGKFSGRHLADEEAPAPADASVPDKAFNAEVGWLFNEVGKERPSATKVEAALKLTEGETHKNLKVRVTFLAKEGKGDKLVEQLDAVVDGAMKLAEMMGETSESVGEVRKRITVSAGSTDTAVVELQGGKLTMGKVDVDETLKALDLRFDAVIQTGRTFQDAMDNIDENCLLVPQGVSFKMSTTFASSVLGEMHARLPEEMQKSAEYVQMITAIAKFSMNEEMHYSSEADVRQAFPMVPNFGAMVSGAGEQMQQMPPVLLDPIKALPESLEHFKSVDVVGLPGGWEFSVKSDDIHLVKVLVKLLTAEEAAEEATETEEADPTSEAAEEATETEEADPTSN